MSDTALVPSSCAPPAGDPVRSRVEAARRVAGICFKIGPPRLAGLELEWVVHEPARPHAPLDAATLYAALDPWCGPAAPDPPALLPAGSRVTVEPGGQVEVSTAPATDLPALLDDAARDAGVLHGAVAAAGLVPVPVALDPVRPPVRLLGHPRYDAMQRYFDRHGSDGRTMMCSTAGLQVCLDAGEEAGPQAVADRWRALHALGPLLVAMTANSPYRLGTRTGWRSARQAAWLGIDPARTSAPEGADPRASYARWALAAPVLCVRSEADPWLVPDRPVSFAEWIDGALHRPPTWADLDYHLTTLFPPVRAQGHLEVRYLDQQRGDDWRPVASLVWALLHDPAVRAAAEAAAAPTAGRWAAAARDGVADPSWRAAAATVGALALDALSDQPADVTAALSEYLHRYALRGRCPADDVLEEMP